jgi:hypothetical protein
MPLLNQSNLETQEGVSAGNITAPQTAVGAENITEGAGNMTSAEGIQPASVNITTNATGTTVETNTTTVISNSTSGGGRRRLQGGRGGVGPPATGGPATTVNVTTVSPVSNASVPTSPGAPPAGQPNATVTSTPITVVNVTTVPSLGNATVGQPGAQPSPPEPSGPANVTAVPISATPNVTAPTPEGPPANVTAPTPEGPPANVTAPTPEGPPANVTAPTPEGPPANVTAPTPEGPPANVTAPTPEAPGPTPPAEPTLNQTAAASTNATLTPSNVTAVQPSENITSTGQENATSVVAGILQAQNQTAPTGQSTVTLENTPVISTDNATNTTELDVSNIAQTLSQFIQQNESGYNVIIPGVGFISIQSQQKKISCVIAKNRNLVSGQPPSQCNTDADCLLEDGTFATCICGMDGTSYCKPDYYDNVFSAFTDQCKNGEMDQEVFVEWVRYHYYYIHLQSAPDCGENLFMELQKASQSEQIAAESSGEVLAMSLVMVLLLLT